MKFSTKTQLLGERQQKREARWVANSQYLDFLQGRERNLQPPKRPHGSMDGAFVSFETNLKDQKTLCWYRAGR